jgi:hypothetical protein
MKKLLLLILITGGSVIYCSSQTNSNDHSKVISRDKIKSGHSSNTGNTSDDLNKKLEVRSETQGSSNGGQQYFEYKVDPGTNTIGENQSNDQPVVFPIVATEYTDPNYEINKQKSLETTRQMEASELPQKTDAELILDLQSKIKAIKDGIVVDSNAVQKLASYEQELQILLNKK